MATTLGELIYKITGDETEFVRSIKKAQGQIKNFESATRKIGTGLTAGVTLPIVGIGAAALKSSFDLEKQKVALEQLLGGAERGGKIFKQIQDFSAQTPLQLPGLVQGAQRLIAFGTAGEDVVERLRQLGDLARGDQATLDRLTLAFGKLQAKGKASLEEINLFTEAGVPLIAELARQFDVTEGEVLKLITAGKVGFPEVQKSIESLTGPTGQFGGLLEKVAQTGAGKLSTALDNLNLAAADLGDVLAPTAIAVIEKITDLAKGFRSLDDNTKNIIVKIAAVVAILGPATIAVGSLTSAIATLNAVALLGPAGLVVGLGLAVGAIALFVTKINEAKDAEKELSDLIERNNKLNAERVRLQNKINAVKEEFLFEERQKRLEQEQEAKKLAEERLSAILKEKAALQILRAEGENLTAAQLQRIEVLEELEKKEQKAIETSTRRIQRDKERIATAQIQIDQLQKFIDQIDKEIETNQDSISAIEELNRKRQEAVDKQNALAAAIAKKSKGTGNDNKKTLEAIDIFNEWIDATDELSNVFNELSEATGGLETRTGRLFSGFAQSVSLVAGLAASFGNMVTVLKAVEKGAQATGAAVQAALGIVGAIVAVVGAIVNGVQANRDKIEEINNEAERLVSQASEAFVQAVKEATTEALKLWEDYAKQQVEILSGLTDIDAELQALRTEKEKEELQKRVDNLTEASKFAGSEEEKNAVERERRIAELELKRIDVAAEVAKAQQDIEKRAALARVTLERATIKAETLAKLEGLKADIEIAKAQAATIVGKSNREAAINRLNAAKASASSALAAAQEVQLQAVDLQEAAIRGQLTDELFDKLNIPNLNTGGIIPGSQAGQIVRIAENNKPELALSTSAEGSALLNEFANRIAEAIGGGKETVIRNELILSDTVLGSQITKLTKNGQAQVFRSALVG
jgi:tape measure domain-containing protein